MGEHMLVHFRHQQGGESARVLAGITNLVGLCRIQEGRDLLRRTMRDHMYQSTPLLN